MTNVNIIMNVDNDAFMHDNLGSEIARILRNYANAIEPVVDPRRQLAHTIVWRLFPSPLQHCVLQPGKVYPIISHGAVRLPTKFAYCWVHN